MIVDRRVFVAGAALAAVAPPGLRILPSEAAVLEMSTVPQPVLMISGWSADDCSVGNQVWLRVNLGWKAAWR